MKTHLLKAVVLGVGMLALSSSMQTTVAANINTSGTVCTNFNGPEALDIDYVNNGVRNINAASRTVICSVPRSPLAVGAIQGRFFVEGRNTSGASTFCTLNSFDFNGTFRGSMSFSSSAATYNQTLALPAAQLPVFGFASLVCTLPGSGNGVLFGVISEQ